MKTKTIKVAIASQKGGGGKSTLTMLLANKLFFSMGKKVMILDCDCPQNTSFGIREDELRKLGIIHAKMSNKEILSADEKILWKYFERSIAEFQNVKEDFAVKVPKAEGDVLAYVTKQIPSYEKEGYDVILFDTVGSISKGANLLPLLKEMDYIFVPVETEESALKPAIASLISFQKMSEKIKVYGFFNKFKMAEKEQYKSMVNVLAIAGQRNLPFLLDGESRPMYAEDKACFRSSLVKSSLFPATYTKAYENSSGYSLITQMCNMVLNETKE